MPYYEKTIRSGKLLEVERYFATRDGRRIPRGSNQEQTPEEQQRINGRNAQKRLMRLICANFSKENGDLFVTYTHGRELTEAEAAREERNLMARLERLRAKKGLSELKRICVTEKQGRWHHHVIMNGGLTLEELKEVWGDRGRMQLSPLDDTYTYEDLSRYLTTEHKPPKGKPEADSVKEPRRKYARRWHASRNLRQPEEKKKEIRRPTINTQPKAPAGYRLLPNWYLGCDVYGNLFFYFACVLEGEAARPQARRGCTPKGSGAKPRRGAGQRPASLREEVQEKGEEAGRP